MKWASAQGNLKYLFWVSSLFDIGLLYVQPYFCSFHKCWHHYPTVLQMISALTCFSISVNIRYLWLKGIYLTSNPEKVTYWWKLIKHMSRNKLLNETDLYTLILSLLYLTWHDRMCQSNISWSYINHLIP